MCVCTWVHITIVPVSLCLNMCVTVPASVIRSASLRDCLRVCLWKCTCMFTHVYRYMYTYIHTPLCVIHFPSSLPLCFPLPLSLPSSLPPSSSLPLCLRVPAPPSVSLLLFQSDKAVCHEFTEHNLAHCSEGSHVEHASWGKPPNPNMAAQSNPKSYPGMLEVYDTAISM